MELTHELLRLRGAFARAVADSKLIGETALAVSFRLEHHSPRCHSAPT